MTTRYENWRTAWVTVMDPADEFKDELMPTPEQAAFMDTHFGTGPVDFWCGELHGYANEPAHNGAHSAELRTTKEHVGTDFLYAYPNGVYVVYSDEFLMSGVPAFFGKVA
jgi:hypothetical protein